MAPTVTGKDQIGAVDCELMNRQHVLNVLYIMCIVNV